MSVAKNFDWWGPGKEPHFVEHPATRGEESPQSLSLLQREQNLALHPCMGGTEDQATMGLVSPFRAPPLVIIQC